MKLLIFGFGFAAAALARRRPPDLTVLGVARSRSTRDGMATRGVSAVDPGDPAALDRAVEAADGLLVAAPPGERGCPALMTLAPRLAGRPALRWIGYLSTTGVYGDLGGRWAFEATPPRPLSVEGERRLAAERGWRDLARTSGAPLGIFRLPGIYGPGRSALDRVRGGEARRLVKPGQVFSRIHVDDLADGVSAALRRPERAGVYNLCDDAPAPPAEVTAFACGLLGRLPQPEERYDPEAMSPMARRFWAESKRVSNARAKAALGWRPAYPSYREGLTAVLAQERALAAGPQAAYQLLRS